MPITHRIVAKTQPVMYHVTRVEFLKSIKRKGLIPTTTGVHSGNFWGYVPNAIYFSSTEQIARHWLVKLSTQNGRKLLLPSLMREYCILKVDISKWQQKLRKDPDTSFGKALDAYYLKDTTVPSENVILAIPMDDAAISKEVDSMMWAPVDFLSIMDWNSEADAKDLWSCLSAKSRTRVEKQFETDIEELQRFSLRDPVYKRNIAALRKVQRMLKI